jgi:3-methyladenine DNA glycosylase AlkD
VATVTGADALASLEAAFRANGCAVNAAAMERYMRGQFPFLGISSPSRRQLQREALEGLPQPDEAELREIAVRLWALSEREFQYAAIDLLARAAKRLTPASLDLCETLITTKSWWDTVDALAGGVAGIIVLHHPEVVARMDVWIEDDNLWLRRSAILHQLKWKDRTDTGRLFGYCLSQAGEKDFFIRKAIGWALRQYSWTDADAVRAFVAEHDGELSGLSKREALLAINGGRTKRAAATPAL